MNMPGLKSHDYQQSFSVILWDAQGQRIGSSGGAPPPACDTSEGFADLRLGADGKLWRSFAQWDLARERQDKIAVAGPATLPLQGHPLLLELALRNLLDNAIKHTPPGTQIEVQLGCGVEGPWLQVCDNGGRDAPQASPAVDSLRLGHEIIARVAEVHGAVFGPAVAPAPFTTCFRLGFANY